MKRRLKQKKGLGWAPSIVVHLGILVLLVVSFKQAAPVVMPAMHPKPAIEAVAIDQKLVEAELKQLKEKEHQKQRKEKKRLAELEQSRRQELAKLEKLKKEAQELKAAKLEAELKRQQALKLAEQLRKEQVVEEKKLLDLKQAQKKIEAHKKAMEQAEAQKRATVLAQKKAQEEAERALQEAIAKEGQQLRFQSELQRYMALIQTAISNHWIRPLEMHMGLKCVVEVRLSQTGEVLQAEVLRSSGNVAFDRSSEAAIRKASPLPMPLDAQLQKEFRHFKFTFNPEAV